MRRTALSAPLSELPSSQTVKWMGSRLCANHLALSPTCCGSTMPVCTRRNATLEGVSAHSARNSTACVRANRSRKTELRGRDRRKLLIWKATTGRGYRRRVRVCSVKLASRFCELKNRTCARRRHRR